MRRVFLPILFIFIALPGMPEHTVNFSLSISTDFTPYTLSQSPGNPNDVMFGLGVTVPFLLWEKNKTESKDDYSFVMIAPEACAEYNPFSNQLRLRTGGRLGKFSGILFIFYDYYIGASGIFLRDFNHDVNTFGIAPEIGFEVLFFSFQVRYEWYTDYRYNRVAVTFGFPLYQLLIFFSIL